MRMTNSRFIGLKTDATGGDSDAKDLLRRMQKRSVDAKKAKKERRTKAAAEAAAKKRAAFKKWNDEQFATAWYNDN